MGGALAAGKAIFWRVESTCAASDAGVDVLCWVYVRPGMREFDTEAGHERNGGGVGVGSVVLVGVCCVLYGSVYD